MTPPSPHFVDVTLLSLIVKGSGKHIMEDAVFEEKGSSLAVTYCGETHSIVCAEKTQIFNIYLDLERHPIPFISEEFNGIIRQFIPPHPAFRNRANRLLRIEFDDISALANIAFALERELREKAPGYLSAASEHFKLFLIECCRQILKNRRHESGRVALPPHTRGLRKPENSLTQTLRIKSPSRRRQKRPGSPKHIFAKRSNSTPVKASFEYLISKRIKEASARLRETDDKIVSIAYDCGFNDVCYFNRQFKKVLGKSPAKFRAELSR